MTAASGFAGEASGSPPRGQQVQRASAGDAVDAVAELGRHYHTLQTWGELYDNDQLPSKQLDNVASTQVHISNNRGVIGARTNSLERQTELLANRRLGVEKDVSD